MSSFGYNILGFGSGGVKPTDPFNANIFVLAGGGGGGKSEAGGGGAGGYRFCASYPIKGATTYVVTVGAGGAAGQTNNPPSNGC